MPAKQWLKDSTRFAPRNEFRHAGCGTNSHCNMCSNYHFK